MKKTTRKIGIGASIVALVVCLVIVTGSTFSLFTSEDQNDISINAAKVDLLATIDTASRVLYSKGIAQPADKFENGGTADFTDSVLTLENVTPGDKVTFNIDLTNSSTIDIQYRITWTCSGVLGEALVVTADDVDITTLVPEWTPWPEEAEDEKTIAMVVELPIETGNDYKGQKCDINFYVEAVQSNAVQPVEVATADQLYTALEMNGYAILLNDITLDRPLVVGKTAELYLAGHTITNANGDALVNNGNLTVNPGSPIATFALGREGAVSEIGSIVSDNGYAIVNNGALTINGGNFKSANKAVIKNTEENSTLLIETGDFNSNVADFAIEFVNVENVTVNDGTFTGAAADLDVLGEIVGEGIGVTKDENKNVVFAPATITVDGKGYLTLADAANAAQAGDEIILLEDTTLSAEVTVPAGVIFNGNGFVVNGTLGAAGDITFKGYNKVTKFNPGYNKGVVTIGEGACLEVFGTDRQVIGHGTTFNITGTIENAKDANVADLQPSLILPGVSYTGAGVNFNVTNAYIKTTTSYSSTSKSASGNFNFNVENSVWEQFGKLAFETQSTAAVVNFNLKDSVLTTTSHLVFGIPAGEVVIDNSNVNKVNANLQFENRTNITIKNGSYVKAAVATSSNAKNPGKLVVDNATFLATGTYSGSDVGIGTLEVRNGASVTVGSFTNANVTVDTASSLVAGTFGANTTLTIDTDNWNGIKSLVFPGRASVPTATFTNTALDPMCKVTDDGVIVMPTAKGSVSPAYTSTSTFWGEGGGNAYESLVVSIYEGDKVIATASLNNIDGIIDGDVYVTWNIPFAGSNDEYWDVKWAENYPNLHMNPTKVTMTIDGTEVAEADQRWNGPDDLNPIVALAERNGKFIGAYTNLTDAMGKFNSRTVRVLRNVTESITGFYGVTLVTDVEGGVKITDPFDADWIDFDDVTLGSGVTLDVDNVYSGDSVNVIEGTLIIRDMMYHAFDAKTTIQNGGSVSTVGSVMLRYNKEADSGIYVYGDGDDSTVEFSCGYYFGAYSGILYAENANIESGYFLLKNSYDNDSYADIALVLDNSDITIVGAKDGQDDFHIDDKASITMKNGSAIKDVREFKILAGAQLTLDVDETSYFNGTNVSIAADLPIKVVKEENGNFNLEFVTAD